MKTKSIFSQFKDPILDFIDDTGKNNLRFPMRKTGNVINNYTRGDFIIVGGRKTSGKSSFILNNYVISPLVQKLQAKKNSTPFEVKVIYLNLRKNTRATIERMVVNYSSQRNGGNKVGVPSLYGYEGTHAKLSPVKAKEIITTAMDTFDALTGKGILSVVTARRSIHEVDNIIRSSMEEYGSLDEETGVFTYKPEHESLIPIVAIDDVTGIFSDTGINNIKNENAHQLANRLKVIAKTYGVILVLAVPSSNAPSKGRGAAHTCSLEEIAPYQMYADRVILMHNPMETNEKFMLGYETQDFISSVTGSCYLRTAFIAANYMGPSGLYFGYFMYPENGYMVELPASENIEEVQVFSDLVNN